MLRVHVRDFGPVQAGEVALRPLTLFIGPNNAGKSCLALLIYALCRAARHFSAGVITGMLHSPVERESRGAKSLQRAIETWAVQRGRRSPPRLFKELPEEAREALCVIMRSSNSLMVDTLAGELQRCFAGELADLVRKNARRNAFRLGIEQDAPLLHLELRSSKEGLRTTKIRYDLSDQVVWRGTADSGVAFGAPGQLMDVMIERLRASLLSGLAQPAYYFPAARSGILQTHKALASALLTRSPLNGTEPGEVPRLSGVVVDFISNLLNVETRRYHPEVSKVARFLESEVGRGRIDIAANEPKFAFPQICYKSMGATYPLQRTSSMVSEIAPIVLFLKYLVNKGNLLIVEEPEAHLHPDSQRTVARAIVRLIRMGVRVLVTTHSDYFVQQISNFIRLNQSPEERARLRYTEQDCLAATEVGAYLFSFGRRATATTVQELEVTGQDGIPEDEFVRIAEAIYRESVRARGVSKQG